jgi:hypothetical protein
MKKGVLLFLVFIALIFQYSCFEKPEEGTWEFFGLEDKRVYRLTLSDSFLYACAGIDGLWRKNINESSSEWQYLGMADSSLVNYPSRGVKDVIINPENTNELLIAFDAVGYETPEVYRSLDGGERWEAADSGLAVNVMGYKQYQRIEKLCYSSDFILAGGSGVYKTYDFGLSWAPVSNPQQIGAMECIMVRHKEIPDVVWFGGTTAISSVVLGSSIDGGDNWRIYENFGDNELNWGYISSIVIHPTDTNTIYVGMEDKLKKTTNGGNSWVYLYDSNLYSTSILIDTDNGDHLWSCGGSIFRESFNAGVSWQEIETPFQSNIRDIIIDENTRSLYFGTVDGVYCYILSNI